MSTIGSLLIGYLLGSLSPAALLSKLKHTDLKSVGTKNLGASNAMLIFGKGSGAFVMLVDILKAYLASRIAGALFPKLALAGLIAGLGAVIGHVFPFYMHFRGGKGLAAFGGMILAFDGWMFLLLLTLGIVLMVIVNYSVAMPMSAAVLFPILALVKTRSLGAFLVCAAASVLVIVKHWSNIEKGKSGRDINIREFIREKAFNRDVKE